MLKRHVQTWLAGPLTILLAILIAGPLVALLSQTLFGSRPSALWQQLIAPTTLTSLRHSLLLGAGTIIGTTVIATPLAWIMTHTRLRAYRWLHWLLLVPFMTPPYINAMGWIYFFQPHGLVQQWLPRANLTFNWLFSPFGMILIMSLHLYPVAYLLLKTALSQFNQRWLDAATVHGVPFKRQLSQIMLPILLVPYLAVWVLVFTKTLAEFGTPATFGRNIHFEVLTTTIQRDLSQWPLDFKNGVLTGSVLLVIALSAWLIQQRFLAHPVVQLTANQAPILYRQPGVTVWAGGFTALLLSTAVGIPYVSIITQSLFKQRSAGIAAGNWTFSHYLELLRFDSPAFHALITTFGLAIVISILNLVLAVLISAGSLSQRLPRWISQTLKTLGALPLAIPNVVLALSLMILFSQWFAFTKLYGSLLVLMIADITLFLPTSVQYITTALQELDQSLVASARVFEANPWRILTKIILPILAPALTNSFAMAFIATSRELVVALLLLPSRMTTISSFIFQSFEQGDASQGMALAVVTVAITFIIMQLTGQLLTKESTARQA